MGRQKGPLIYVSLFFFFFLSFSAIVVSIIPMCQLKTKTPFFLICLLPLFPLFSFLLPLVVAYTPLIPNQCWLKFNKDILFINELKKPNLGFFSFEEEDDCF